MIQDMCPGQWVRVIAVPPNLRDEESLKTRTLFEDCPGKCFRIERLEHVEGLNYPLAELHVGHLDGREPSLEVIWVEPEYLEHVERESAPSGSKADF